MKKIQTQPKHANKLMQKWEDERLQKNMSDKVRGAKSSVMHEGALPGSRQALKGQPAKGAQAQRRRRVPAKKLDEEINAGLHKVLSGMSRQKPRRPAADVAAAAAAIPRKPVVVRTEIDAEEVTDEDPYLDDEWEAECQLSARKGPAMPRTSSVASSIQEEVDMPPLTPAEEPVHFKGPSRGRSGKRPGAQPELRHDAEDVALLSQSITQLHALVNAKIQTIKKRKEPPGGSKIPGAPSSRVRPVSANTMARTRIPRLGSGSPSSAATPAKGASCQPARAQVAADKSGNARRTASSRHGGASQTSTLNSRKDALPGSKRTINECRSQIVDKPKAGKQVSMPADDKPLPAASNTRSSRMPQPLIVNDNSPSASFSDTKSDSSGSMSSTKTTLTRLGSGLHDSTEIGLGEALEIAVEGSMVFNADLDAFRSKMQQCNDTAKPHLNSTDHLLEAFLKQAGRTDTSLEEDGDSSYSDIDDFDEVEVVEEDIAMGNLSHREISMQAEALFGSLHQLHALMASPGLSRRNTDLGEANLGSVPETGDSVLDTTQLSMACSILEESLRISSS